MAKVEEHVSDRPGEGANGLLPLADVLWRELMKAGYDRRMYTARGDEHTRADAEWYAAAVLAAIDGHDDRAECTRFQPILSSDDRQRKDTDR